MTDERPLHVRVAEALGWTDLLPANDGPFRAEHWSGVPPAGLPMDAYAFVLKVDHENRIMSVGPGSVPRYDTDWSATGPIIERLGLNVGTAPMGMPGFAAIAPRGVPPGLGLGDTLLVAVCELLLSLNEQDVALADLLKAEP